MKVGGSVWAIYRSGWKGCSELGRGECFVLDYAESKVLLCIRWRSRVVSFSDDGDILYTHN